MYTILYNFCINYLAYTILKDFYIYYPEYSILKNLLYSLFRI